MTPLTKPQRLLLAISIGLICAGLVPRVLPGGVSGPVSVAIIEDRAARASLEPGQLALINSTTFPASVVAAGGTFLGCFDQNIVDKDKRTPADIAPYIESAQKLGKLPALCYRRAAAVTAIPLPASEAEAIKTVGGKP